MRVISVIDQISQGGFRHKANEDRVGIGGCHAWVIDGATGLGEPFMGAGSDAAWLAQRAHEALTRHAALTQPDDLMAALADDLVGCFEAERTRPLAEAWELPCGAFMLATADEGVITITWSGDCRALVQPAGGPVSAFGASPVSEEAEAALVAQVGAAGDPAERFREPGALVQLRAMRALALAAGNARILAPDPGFVRHLAQAVVVASEADVLLMTDGFAAAELRYGVYASPQALMAAARRDGLAEIVQQLRRFERETDPDGKLKPRWKRCDDATAIWLKISN